MAGGVAGHVQHAQVQVQFRYFHAVALRQRHVAARQAFPRRAVYGDALDAGQFGYAADMVAMTVRQQNGAQPQALLLEQPQHGAGLAGVHHGGLAVAHDCPDVVVGESG
ncbi:hypothetical protein D9M70_644530 [compost metagenome]